MRPKPSRTPRNLVRAVLLGLVVATFGAGTAGAAFAYWAGSGGGPGSAATEDTVAVLLSPGSPAATLHPGGQASVVLTVSNPNASVVRIGSLALDTSLGVSGIGVDAPHSACDPAAVSFTTQTNSGAGWTVPARVSGVDGTLPVSLTDALAMSVDAANACQGASFTVYLTVGA